MTTAIFETELLTKDTLLRRKIGNLVFEFFFGEPLVIVSHKNARKYICQVHILGTLI